MHLRMLGINKKPCLREIISLPHFDRTPAKSLGRVLFYGQDHQQNNVYIVSLGPARQATLSALRLFLQARGMQQKDVLIIDALQCVNLSIRVGGFLSRRCGLVALGRHLCAYGIVANFACFKILLSRVEEDMKGLTTWRR